jgi:hypothetical protein
MGPRLETSRSSSCDQAQQQGQENRPEDCDNDRIEHASRTGMAKRPHDEATDNGTDDADDNVHDGTVAATAHNLACNPACDQTDDNPPEQKHGFLFRAHVAARVVGACVTKKRCLALKTGDYYSSGDDEGLSFRSENQRLRSMLSSSWPHT